MTQLRAHYLTMQLMIVVAARILQPFSASTAAQLNEGERAFVVASLQFWKSLTLVEPCVYTNLCAFRTDHWNHWNPHCYCINKLQSLTELLIMGVECHFSAARI